MLRKTTQSAPSEKKETQQIGGGIRTVIIKDEDNKITRACWNETDCDLEYFSSSFLEGLRNVIVHFSLPSIHSTGWFPCQIAVAMTTSSSRLIPTSTALSVDKKWRTSSCTLACLRTSLHIFGEWGPCTHQPGLPHGLLSLAVSWLVRRALADTRQIGKLTREQFALAMHLIQQKVMKGVDPPQALTADMIPPSERGTPIIVGPSECLSPLFLVWYSQMNFNIF